MYVYIKPTYGMWYMCIKPTYTDLQVRFLL
jgi:hypothetical protein